MCWAGHEAHVGALLSRQQLDGSVHSSHRLSSAEGSPVLSMGEVHARPLRAAPAAALQPAALQQRVPRAFPTTVQASFRLHPLMLCKVDEQPTDPACYQAHSQMGGL